MFFSIDWLHRKIKGEKYYSPNGHFYSPVVSIKDIKARKAEIWKDTYTDGIAGINLNFENQFRLLKDMAVYYKEIPFKPNKEHNLRYYFENPFYSYTDGILLYSMIRHFAPKRIIEVGSGFSSSVMLDVNEIFFANRINLTFIDPYPDRLLSLMTESDKKNAEVITDTIQQVDLSNFKRLEKGDILFIDSSHVSKSGSDLNHILFNILPLLNPGVLIHFHDIFHPFEYPQDWVLGGRSWNENYFLRAFLMYNDRFEIKIFSHYLHVCHKEAFENMPLAYKNFGGNLWIEKK